MCGLGHSRAFRLLICCLPTFLPNIACHTSLLDQPELRFRASGGASAAGRTAAARSAGTKLLRRQLDSFGSAICAIARHKSAVCKYYHSYQMLFIITIDPLSVDIGALFLTHRLTHSAGAGQSRRYCASASAYRAKKTGTDMRLRVIIYVQT